MPLSMVKAGEPNVIKKVGGKSETKKFPWLRCWWSGDRNIRNQWQSHCECQRFQSCYWKRYG